MQIYTWKLTDKKYDKYIHFYYTNFRNEWMKTCMESTGKHMYM